MRTKHQCSRSLTLQLNDARFQYKIHQKSAPKQKPVSSCAHFIYGNFANDLTFYNLSLIRIFFTEITFQTTCISAWHPYFYPTTFYLLTIFRFFFTHFPRVYLSSVLLLLLSNMFLVHFYPNFLRCLVFLLVTFIIFELSFQYLPKF